MTISKRGVGIKNKDLFFTEGGDHVKIRIHNLKQAPVFQWPTVDQNLFFGLNLYEIVHVTIICTRKTVEGGKKKRENRFQTVSTVLVTHTEISISSP